MGWHTDFRESINHFAFPNFVQSRCTTATLSFSSSLNFYNTSPIQIQRFLQNDLDRSSRQIFIWINPKNLHPRPFTCFQCRVVKMFPFDHEDIRLVSQFISPQITEHLFLVTETWHSILSSFSNIRVLIKNDTS